MPQLLVRCKECEEEIETEIYMDKREFKETEMDPQEFECSQGHIDDYNKKEMFCPQWS